jgi:hypothetical protein
MIPRQDARYKIPVLREKSQENISALGKSAYLLFSGTISTLIAILSILLVFSMVSLLTTNTISGITLPQKIPNWGAAILLLIAYTIIVLPLKALRYRVSPHKSYSLYGSGPTPKYGDATLWLALFILLTWYASEHREEFSVYLKNFPAWWRNFVDTVGPWFYR